MDIHAAIRLYATDIASKAPLLTASQLRTVNSLVRARPSKRREAVMTARKTTM